MHTFQFMAPNGRVDKLKKVWASDQPLTLAEGGSFGPVPTEEAIRVSTLTRGGKLHGLGTLTQIANDASLPSLGIEESRIEALGRRFWTKAVEVSPDSNTSNGSVPATHSEISSDVFWKSHCVSFPDFWPDQCAIPVGVMDPKTWPKQYRVLCFDELVLSFWKFVGYLQSVIDIRTQAKKKYPDQADTYQASLAVLSEQMASARRLQRNVPFIFMHTPTEADRYTEALSLREDIEALREDLGLSGWARVLIVGNRRDELKAQSNGKIIKNEEVVAALKNIRWARGREMSPDTVDKLLSLYDKFSGQPNIVRLIKDAQEKLGRNSPFEEHSKMLLVAQRCGSIADCVWVLEWMLADQSRGRVDGFSKQELQKKHGAINVYLLRKRVAEGLTQDFIDPVLALAATRADLKGVADALQALCRRYASPMSYLEQDTAAADDIGLPRWCGVQLQRLLRQTMVGYKDKIFTAMLLKPPKAMMCSKGPSLGAKWPQIREMEGFKTEVEELAKLRKAWFTEHTKPNTDGTPATKSGLDDGAKLEVSPQNTTDHEEILDDVQMVRCELTARAKELRRAFVAVIPQGATALATKQQVSTSSVATTSQSLALLYAIPCAYDLPRMTSRPGRMARPTPISVEHLTHFIEVADKFLDADGAPSYACVFLGRVCRGGAGLAVEAGISVEQQVVSLFKDKGTRSGPLRVKRFRIGFATEQTGARHHVVPGSEM